MNERPQDGQEQTAALEAELAANEGEIARLQTRNLGILRQLHSPFIIGGGAEGHSAHIPGLRAITSTGGRDANEDAMYLNDLVGEWAAIDGMGGHENGEKASLELAKFFAERAGDKTPVFVLFQAAKERLTQVLGDKSNAGAALAYGRISNVTPGKGADILFAHVGDSKPMVINPTDRSYIYDPESQDNARNLIRLDEADNFYQRNKHLIQGPMHDALKEEFLRLLHPKGNILNNAFQARSDRELKTPVAEHKSCPNGSIVLFLSDGITSIISKHEILEIFCNNDFETGVSLLNRLAKQRQEAIKAGQDIEMVLQKWADGQVTTCTLPAKDMGEDNYTFVAKQINF